MRYSCRKAIRCRSQEVENAAKNIFIAGLRNAHSMEIQARELMERQSESLEGLS